MRKQSYLYALMFIFFLFSDMGASENLKALNVMPAPAKVVPKKGKFRLAESFKAGIKKTGTRRLYRGINRWLDRLSGRTGLFLKHGRVEADHNPAFPDLQILCRRTGKLVPGEDESYVLKIRPGFIKLRARTDIGILHGLETLLQLLDADDRGYFFPAITVRDRPRFPWRGLLIDSARHFLPLEVMKRNLEGMAAVKMNVLHWHLTDDQGFRVECETFPKLHQLGSDGFYYTREQIREVIGFAADRGIRVVPEFDIPGHSTSWLAGYPQLASAPGPYAIERKWGVFDPTFNPALEETYQFFDRFFGEMAELFPDAYVHIGGDENNGKQWDANPDIQAFMKEHRLDDNHALQAYFNRRILKILTKYGKRMMGWDEILQPGLPGNVMIQSWRGVKFLRRAAQEGYFTILSNGYYIDLCQPTVFHYLNDPVPAGSDLTGKERSMIYGGEATMWGELITPETVDSRIWPRTAAIAERLWSPAETRDVNDMYRRLEVVSRNLEELGIMHLKNPEMMRRRLAVDGDSRVLKALTDVVEPVKEYRRHRQGKTYTSLSPLTRLVDIAVPDPLAGREFNHMVKRFLGDDEPNRELAGAIKERFVLWKENHPRLLEIIKCSPVLAEAETLSETLAGVSAIGLQAVEMILSHNKGETAWIEESRLFLKGAAKPRAEVEITILPAVEALLDHLSPR